MEFTGASISCHSIGSVSTNGIFEGEMPLNFFLPRLAFQVAFISFLNLAMQELLRPLGQSRYIASLIAGLLLGPSFLGHFAPELVDKYLFPESGRQALQVVVQVGVRFWYFLFGAQIHIGPMLKKMTSKARWIGTTSLMAPLLLCYPIASLVNKIVPATMHCDIKPLFLGMYFVMTNVSVIAGNVIDHELLDTDLGSTAMSSAIFIAIASALPINGILWLVPVEGKPYDAHWRVLCGTAFVAFLCFVARPIINWIVQHTQNEEDVKEHHVCGVLLGALVASVVTESIGAHITFGAFTYGLMMPHCALTTVVTKRLEDFNTMVLMPPFFAVIGLTIKLQSMFTSPKDWTLVLILFILYLGKISFIGLAASRYNMPKNEGLLLGVLMSSKGILDIMLVTWSTGKRLNGADGGEFSILMVGIVVTNLIIGPTVSFLYKRPTLQLHRGCRSIQELKPNSELRILSCVYDHETVPALINVVHATPGTKMSPVNISILHLVHATTRDSTMQQQSFETGGFFRGHDSGSVAEAMKMHKWTNGTTTNLQTKLSSYSTMPEHIVHAAESGRATITIIPFHMRRVVGSHIGVSNDTVRNINVTVLEKAPCSVGVFVDLACAGATTKPFQNVVVLYFGGHDDRETLSYASRMAEQEPTRLTVVRFLPPPDAASTPPPYSSFVNEDDLCIHRFRSMAEGKLWITYTEKFVSCGADMVTAVQGMNKIHDLFMVGRRHGPATARMLSGLEAWSEYPELGTVGDLLVSPDFSAQAVLVMQQHTWAEDYEVELGDGRESVHDLHSQEQGYRYVLHDQSKDSAPLRHRAHNSAIAHNEVQFDEFGWNWNLRAGF
ncbi:Cation/H(+) antiporter 15 [Nymphaea thermarum]|nr:Cation/H(+) antiporter 15 [Nymphaea thermarum]